MLLVGLLPALLGMVRSEALRSGALGQINAASAISLRSYSSNSEELQALSQDMAGGCEIEASGPICLGESEQALLPPAVQPGLVGYWSFDEEAPLDTSGHGNHGTVGVMPGPTLVGMGSSAAFKQSFLTIPNAMHLQLQDFSYTFWLYLLQDGGSSPHTGLKWCPVLRKGIHNPATQEFAAAPAVLIDRTTSKMRVALTTNVVGSEGGEIVDSNARLNRRQWYHIAVVRLNGEKRTRLYVNGILDATAETQGYVEPNKEPLYVGGDPWVLDQCNVPMYVDELKVFAHPLPPDEIQAEAALSLGGIEPSFIRLGCISCPLEVAMANCPMGYHVCNSLELHMGGYQVARTMGWLQPDTHVWTHATVSNAAMQGMTASTAGEPGPTHGMEAPAGVAGGLGLCCADVQ
jgi:hypothetical protein